LIPRGAEGPHPHVDVRAQHLRQLGDMDAGAAIDLGRILLGEQIDTHVRLLLMGSNGFSWAESDHRTAPGPRCGPRDEVRRDGCHFWTILAPCRPKRFSPSFSPAARGSG